MRFKAVACNRKDIVKTMESLLEAKAIYMGPPTFGYEVGNFTIDRDGYVECESDKEGEWMLAELAGKGMAENAKDTLSIEMPLDTLTTDTLKNLVFMIHSKQHLLEKSVGVAPFKVSERLIEKLMREEFNFEEMVHLIDEDEPTGIDFINGKIRFTGFPYDAGTAKIYTELVSRMVALAKEQKRINPQETLEENEKYYMRIWLVRLGFGGKDGKEARHHLLANLKGHTAFRTEADKEKWMAKNYNKSKKQEAEENE